jgi:D-lactate dehydrogenase
MTLAPAAFEGTPLVETVSEQEIGRNLEAALRAAFPPDAVKLSEIYRAVYARDGSYFEYHPRAVVRVACVEDVQALLRISAAHGVPLTLRAGGSSLSGQTVGTGIVVDQRFHFRRWELRDGARRVWFEPGVTVLQLNGRIKSAGVKVGPDPASSQVAMMGGVLANNASGMQAGTKYNSYKTLASIEFVLPDGNRYDTAKPEDRARFAAEEAAVYAGLASLRDEVRADDELSARIRRKYQIKNVCGYALNAFLDYDAPLDIGRAPAPRPVPALPGRQPHGHVRRPAGVLRRPGRLPTRPGRARHLGWRTRGPTGRGRRPAAAAGSCP